MFNESDLVQIKNKGISIETISKQIEYFKSGFPFMHLERAATIGDGIKSFDEIEVKEMSDFYDANKDKFDIVKFVPASGAATRMFKALFEYLSIAKTTSPSQSNKSIQEFFGSLSKFAFYQTLQSKLPQNSDDATILETLLLDSGMGYGSLPKGLLEFHQYGNATRTAAQEQMIDGFNYANANQTVKLHFTVSPEHRQKFSSLIDSAIKEYESILDVKFNISFSEQKPSTDTIAVDLNYEPFRNTDGSLLFRPAGHGALLENLNDLEASIIFIKNIDNVVPDHFKSTMTLYKTALAGLLIQLQNKFFDYQEKSEKAGISEVEIKEIELFLEKEIGYEFDKSNENTKLQQIKNKLFRPIRICGMVKNIGEPGGGPFWTKNNKGEILLQIVESAQIDLENPIQRNIFVASTHFNPVDLICTTRNYKGEKYNLFRYIDSETGFITKKSQNGADLLAQELPGLWNGSMANWNTIFVEIPLITFNPVKTVNDLLRKEHQ